MAAPLLVPNGDYDPYDHSVDLGSEGLSDYCAATVIGTDGEPRYMLLRSDTGTVADYWPDWENVAPHEIVGLPTYWKH